MIVDGDDIYGDGANGGAKLVRGGGGIGPLRAA
jgi:hypothetical protein